MGRTIASLIADDPDFYLAVALERPQSIESLSYLSCPVTSSLQEAIELAPEAVIIDFTAPAASMEAARIAAAKNIPVVIGSTGFSDDQKKQLGIFAKSTPLLWSANMSIGVNALLDMLPALVKALGPDYDIELAEIHHKHKKDAPSGTALMFGENLAHARGQALKDVRAACRDGVNGPRKEGEIGIQAIRGGEVVGVHTIWFFGPAETIEIVHRVDSRENFARGALRAAAWLRLQKPGIIYNMQNVLANS